MATRVEAIYENGVLKLAAPLELEDRTRVQVTIETVEGTGNAEPAARNLGAVEAELLQRINEGLAPETWERYRALLDKRRAEMLGDKEHAQLVALSDQIEEAGARRTEHLVALARLRKVPLEVLMHDLRITATAYE